MQKNSPLTGIVARRPRADHFCRVIIVALLACLAALWSPTPLSADETADVMLVEEDWEVVLNEPGEDVDAPQFHTIISPFSNLDSFHLQVCWNYRDMPWFEAGGMQLIAWLGDWCVGSKSYRDDKLSTEAETITWTSSILTNGSTLSFRILNGSSSTWGSFGGSDTSLSGDVHVPTLNGYSTDFSVANSWISYGANRVNILRIKEVRRFDGEGNLISRDTSSRTIYELKE